MATNQSVTAGALYGTDTKADYLASIWRASFKGWHRARNETRRVMCLLGAGGDIPYIREAGVPACNIYGVERDWPTYLEALKNPELREINLSSSELRTVSQYMGNHGEAVDILSLDFCAFVYPGMLDMIRHCLENGVLAKNGRIAITYMHSRDKWFRLETESIYDCSIPHIPGEKKYLREAKISALRIAARKYMLRDKLNEIGVKLARPLLFELIAEDSYVNHWLDSNGEKQKTGLSWIILQSV